MLPAGGIFRVYGPVNSARMGPYFNLDLRYEKKFVYALWQWSAYIDVSHVENWFGKGYHSPEINRVRVQL